MKAVLLDRDGVINALVYHHEAGIIEAPSTESQFKILPRVPAAIRLLNELGLRVAIVSNQPGIAKGHLKPEMLKTFDRILNAKIRKGGGHIDSIHYCLHHPEAKAAKFRRRCHCRKPEIGLLEEAASDFQVPLSECYMIGDGIPDLLAGCRAGCRTIFVGRWKCEICQLTGLPHVRPAFAAKDLWEAAKFIRKEMSGEPNPVAASTCVLASA